MATDRVASNRESEMIDYLHEAIEKMVSGKVKAIVVAMDDGTGGDFDWYTDNESSEPYAVCLASMAHQYITLETIATRSAKLDGDLNG
jgi:hypothetical protein